MTEPLWVTLLPWMTVPVTTTIGLFAFIMQRPYRLRRRLRRTSLTRMADVRPGTAVKLVGTVEYHAEPLAAPLSDRACAFYRIEVWERRGRDWPRQIFREERGVDFCLRDESGVVLVRPESRALSDLTSDFTPWITSSEPVDTKLLAYLKQHDISVQRILRQRSFWMKEAIVVPGKQLAVAGIAQREVEVAVNYREAAPPTPPIVLAAVGDAPLIISDDASTFGR